MGLKSRIIDRGRQLVQSPAVMRWVSDDRVMKAAEGVLDAKTRVRLAWHMLKNGHALPPVDPALDDSLGETEDYSNGNGSSHERNGSNGSRERLSNGNGSSARGNGSSNGNGKSVRASSNGSA